MNQILSPELYPTFWLILAVALAIAEAATVQLVAIWFAAGAAAAILPAKLGMSMWAQFWVFALVSALLLACTRPYAKRILNKKHTRTNADQVIGQTGTVLTAVDSESRRGRVMVMGLDWSALSQDGNEIQPGEKVTVLAIEGVKLIVRKKAAPAQEAQEEEAKL